MRKLKISNIRVKVIAHFHEEGSVLRGDKRGMVDGFDIEISLDTQEPENVIRQALDLAHQMCFTEVVITQAVKINSTHIVNDNELPHIDV